MIEIGSETVRVRSWCKPVQVDSLARRRRCGSNPLLSYKTIGGLCNGSMSDSDSEDVGSTPTPLAKIASVMQMCYSYTWVIGRAAYCI
jgi:hypothetical protein